VRTLFPPGMSAVVAHAAWRYAYVPFGAADLGDCVSVRCADMCADGVREGGSGDVRARRSRSGAAASRSVPRPPGHGP
jgi:hypothetical protein